MPTMVFMVDAVMLTQISEPESHRRQTGTLSIIRGGRAGDARKLFPRDRFSWICTSEQQQDTKAAVTINPRTFAPNSNAVGRAMKDLLRSRFPLPPLLRAYLDGGVRTGAELGQVPGLGPRLRAVLAAAGE